MKYRIKSEKIKRKTYNQFIEEAGIKKEIDEENQKKLAKISKPKLNENIENLINNKIYDESNIENSFSELNINNLNNELINSSSINLTKKIIYDNGEIYIGDIKNGLKHGKGKMLYKSKDEKLYEGDFKENKREGKGILYYNNTDRYEGDFQNNIRNGKGILYYNNGDKYEGLFENDLIEGMGTDIYNDDSKYEGEFKNNKREGKGIYF